MADHEDEPAATPVHFERADTAEQVEPDAFPPSGTAPRATAHQQEVRRDTVRDTQRAPDGAPDSPGTTTEDTATHTSIATEQQHADGTNPSDALNDTGNGTGADSGASTASGTSTPSWLYPGTGAPPQAPGRAAAHTSSPRRENRRGILTAAVAAGAITGILAGTAASMTTDQLRDSIYLDTASKIHIAQTPQTDSVAANWVTSVSNVLQPSVVSVIATRNGVPMSTGSGVVLTDDGYIMTNAHVVSGADDVSIRLSDATTLPGTISGADTVYDIAVVKVNRTLPAATFNLEPVQVGEPVAAFGAPLGLYGTVTVGIVSAVARPVTAGDGSGETSIVSAVQTDAAVNPGNSGGPLVNADGEVVGVNSSIATLSAGPGSGSIGLGFAIPSSTAVRVATELADRGYAERPLVGVSIGPASPFGARVDGLTAGGPAEAAGILVGDVLTAIDGVQAESPVAAIALIRSAEPGKTIRLTVLRNDSLIDIEVVSQAERGPLRGEPTPSPVPSQTPSPSPSP